MSRGLSKAGIVQAALGVLDEAGFDGLTVRAVAGRLGVQAPALYWHVRDKQELIDEMATDGLAAGRRGARRAARATGRGTG